MSVKTDLAEAARMGAGADCKGYAAAALCELDKADGALDLSDFSGKLRRSLAAYYVARAGVYAQLSAMAAINNNRWYG